MTHIEENFDTRLDRLHFTGETTSYPAAERYTLELGSGGDTTARTVIQQMGTTGLPANVADTSDIRLVRAWEDFIFVLRTAKGQPQGDELSGAIFETFRAEFMLSQGINPNTFAGNLGDFEILFNSSGATDRTDFINELFVQAFNHFIQDYDHDFGSENPEVAFYNAWNRYLTITNFLGIDSFALFPPPLGHTTAPSIFTVENLTSFKRMYFSFVPNATDADFENRLSSFFTDILNEHQYFVANHFAADWFQAVLQERLNVSFGGTAVDGTGSDKVKIIFTLFSLLTELLGVLQRVAATQAQRLQFYANMQQAYTELISRIPTITTNNFLDTSGGGGIKFDGGDDNLDKANQAQQQMSAVLQAYTERLRSFRTVWSDEARAHQTSVNQTNETVNQQSNLATALLQQVSTILQGIFR